MSRTSSNLWPFVAQHHLALLARGHRSSVVDGTVLFADVSGFTALSERLERRGREGAELMSDLLGAIFGPMLDLAMARGGDLLGYGGDALLLLFTGPDHGRQAVATAGELLGVLGRRTPAHRAAGRVTLTMSMGAESGPVALFAAGSGLTQLIAAGPVLDLALTAEAQADGGELLVGPRLARTLGRTRPYGRGLRLISQYPEVVPSGPSPRHPDQEAHAEGALASALSSYLALEGRFGEHRPVTACFVKHCFEVDPDSTSSRRRAARRLDRITDAVLGLCERHALTLVTPDALVGAVKFSIVGGAPVARGDSVDASIAFALDLLAAVGDAVSIGINQGTVFCGEIGGRDRRVYAVLGDAMNLAARVMSRAQPGEALIEAHTASTARVTPGLHAIEPFAAKGKRELVHAFRLAKTSGPTPDRPTELLGREAELQALSTAWAEASAGRSISVAIEAPPGLGKSSLLQAWLEQHRLPRVLQVRGGRLARLSPFLALSIGLREHLGLADTPDDDLLIALDRVIDERAPAVSRWRGLLALALGSSDATESQSPVSDERLRTERLHEALAALLAPPGAALVLAVDDAQWLDDASEAALIHLAKRGTGGVVAITAIRAGEASVLAELAEHHIDLRPLTDGVARRIVRSRAPTPLPIERVEEIVRRADGNPLFLAALATSGADRTLPGTVEEAIRSELDRLPPSTRRTLGDLAVLGSTASEALVTAVLGEQVGRTLGSIGADDFIRVDDGETTFVHPLRREVAYEAMPFRDRRAAHARALDYLLALDEPPSSLVALHAWNSNAYADTWKWARLAAAEPSARFAPATAAEHLEWAVASGRRVRGLAVDERAAVLDELGDTYERLGRFIDAERMFRSALSLDGDDTRTVRRMCRVARQCEQQGELSRGLTWARRAGRIAAPASASTQALPWRAETSLLFRSGDLHPALTANDVAMHLAAAAGDQEMLVQTYRMAGTIKELMGLDGVRDLRRAIDLSTAIDDHQSAAWAFGNLGAALYDRGQWTEATERYASCRTLAAGIGDTMAAATASNNMAEILSDQGHLAAAEAFFADALDVFEGAGYRIGRAVALGNLGRVHRRSGELARAAVELDASIDEFGSIGADDFVTDMRLRRVELELARDQIDQATHELEGALIGDHDDDIGPLRAAAHRLAAIVAVRQGDHEHAAVELRTAAAIAKQARYRYEGTLTLEIAVLSGIDGAARSPTRLKAKLDDLGIVDTGQRMLLKDSLDG